ncbi:MAG TPA: sodium transporter [Bacteroidetes bacterium]|nr:sodium transporter [Bacteroidota bacterium]
MHNVDFIIVGVYLLVMFAIGLFMKGKAGQSITSYFVADRSLPGWWVGLSILATTFAADTPLAVTGLTAKGGVQANWFWWSWVIGYIVVALVMAKRWRRAQVLTDVEFIELRYDGASASALRAFKALFLGVLLNGFILGWVITAMTKIADPFIQWSALSPPLYELFSCWPSWLLINDLNTTITVILVLLIVMIYSAAGGIRGVILTDLFQFGLAMGTAILFAYFAVDYVGGLGAMHEGLAQLKGDSYDDFTNIIPSKDSTLLPFRLFIIYVLIQWWVRYDSDGTGYIAQRFQTARNDQAAKEGGLWFAIGFAALRAWPWIIVALCSVLVFPTLDDPEMGYPLMMKKVLPVGLLGLTFTSLLAAFMSTVDTHLNWGASYLVNDVYLRFLRPNASSRQAIYASRLAVVFIFLIAVIFASQMTSISGAWVFFINAASGLGIAQLLRWLWWRANAWTEISALSTGFITTVALQQNIYPIINLSSDYHLVIVAGITLVVCLTVTFLTPAPSPVTIKTFQSKTSPIGFWPSTRRKQPSISIYIKEIMVALGAAFGILFGIGYCLMLHWLLGGLFIVIGTLCTYALIQSPEKQKKNQSL